MYIFASCFVAIISYRVLTNADFANRTKPGKFIALDCEMVGVGDDPDNNSVLARVSIVNYHGEQLYDSFVLPQEEVTDWRTHVSGVTRKHMTMARDFETVQKDVANLIEGRVLVGHALKNDLEVLFMSHPKKDLRDTSRFGPFRKMSGGKAPRLKKLAKDILGVDIQCGEHSSVRVDNSTPFTMNLIRP